MAGSIPVKENTNTGPKTAPAKKATPRKAVAKKAPGKAVAKVTKPADKSDFTPAAAKKLTEKIKKSAATTYEDIKKAYLGRIWLALDCKSWDEYLDKNYEGIALPLPREKKKEAIQSLAAAGVSTRAIAAATGVNQSTVVRNQKKDTPKAPDANASPAQSNVIDIDPKDVTEIKDGDGLGEFAGEPEEQRRQGADGKSYPASQPPREPAVVNVVSAARTLSKDLENVRIRLDSLFSREDYEQNKVDVQGTLETAVGDLIDTLVEEFGDLVRERTPQGEPEPAV